MTDYSGRNVTLEFAAKVSDMYADEFEKEIAAGNVTHLTADAALLMVRSISESVRALKQAADDAGHPEGPSSARSTSLIIKLCNAAKESPGCLYPACDCGRGDS